MMDDKTFLAPTGRGLARAELNGEGWLVDEPLNDVQVNCLAVDPFVSGRIYAGTQENGVQVSEDQGRTWQPLASLGVPVKSLAVSPHTPGLIYAGGKPVSLYVSRDSGETWAELPALRQARRWWWFSPAEPPDWNPYVMALTLSPTDPKVLMAGIELGGVLRSEDGGLTWSKHRRGAGLDCHSLTFHHTDGNWVYEGSGSGAGSAYSQDGGLTWQKPNKSRMWEKYGFMVAADPGRPEVWYLSASPMPNLLRGEFIPPAHQDGQARAAIYRSVGGAPLEKLSGGLPEPMDYLAYSLVTVPEEPGHLYAGLSNGEVWHTADYGDNWVCLPIDMGSVRGKMVVLATGH
jgi:hypothetical protein